MTSSKSQFVILPFSLCCQLLVLLMAVGLAAADQPCQRQCSRIYAPVCSTDGQTATNKCQFQVYQCEQRKINLEVAIAHEGPCKKLVTGCPVTSDFFYIKTLSFLVCNLKQQSFCNNHSHGRVNQHKVPIEALKHKKINPQKIRLIIEQMSGEGKKYFDSCLLLDDIQWIAFCDEQCKKLTLNARKDRDQFSCFNCDTIFSRYSASGNNIFTRLNIIFWQKPFCIFYFILLKTSRGPDINFFSIKSTKRFSPLKKC